MAEIPKIDFTKIDFPSDELTIRTIRRLHPEQADTGEEIDLFFKPFGGKAGELISSMLQMERDLVRATFDSHFGIEPSILYADNNTNILVNELIALYQRYGIADGPITAKELVRGIESQAISQARQHTGPLP